MEAEEKSETGDDKYDYNDRNRPSYRSVPADGIPGPERKYFRESGGAGKGAGLCQGTSFSAQCHGPQSGGQRHQADRRGTDGYLQLFFRGFGEIYGTGGQGKGLQPDIV